MALPWLDSRADASATRYEVDAAITEVTARRRAFWADVAVATLERAAVAVESLQEQAWSSSCSDLCGQAETTASAVAKESTAVVVRTLSEIAYVLGGDGFAEQRTSQEDLDNWKEAVVEGEIGAGSGVGGAGWSADAFSADMCWLSAVRNAEGAVRRVK